MSAAQRLLDRLPRVRQTRPGSYLAGCPVCKSRIGRPIKVDTPEDGRVLIHAFCACSTGDVLEAIGLTLADLFDTKLHQNLPPIRGSFTARELLELVHHEITVAGIILTEAETKAPTAEQAARLRQVSARIGKALGMLSA